MKKIITVALLLGSGSAWAAAISGQGTWEATLQARDLDGDRTTAEAYYDTVLDIIWLADAGYAQTSGYDADNRMTWDEAQSWIGTLNSSSYLGVSDWRLPQVWDAGSDGCNFSYDGTDCGWNADTSTGEMASLFYDTLGNLAALDTEGNFREEGYDHENSGPFSNIPFFYTWADTESVVNSGEAWYFHLGLGTQNDADKTLERATWAVRSGDIGTSVVPIPAAVWLFASALAGLGCFRRRQTA